MTRALIVEDNSMNREILCEMLEDDFELVTAADGVEALERIDEYGTSLSVVLLDLVMPRLDGFGVLNGIRDRGLAEDLPVLIISGEAVEAERRCFDYGVSDFIRKPFDERIVKRRVKNASDLAIYRRHLEATVDLQTQELQKQNRQLAEQAEQLKKSNINIMEIMGSIVEARNMESGQHIQRVKLYSGIIGRTLMRLHPEYGLTEQDVEFIMAASPLHDVGKIMIPDAVLLKPGRFTPEEWETMKAHTLMGCDLLNRVKYIWDESYYRMSWEICRWHHEKYDGRGYPDGLAGDDIPISAQIVAVADVYDALVNERPYKKAFSKEKAYEMIIGGECGAFNPKLMECFTAAREEMEKYAGGVRILTPNDANM